MNLPTANAVLAVDDHPHCGKPLVQPDSGVLEDRASLERELPGGVLLAALPTVVLFEEQHILAAAARTHDAFRPASGDEVLAAVFRLGEVENRLLQAFRFHA